MRTLLLVLLSSILISSIFCETAGRNIKPDITFNNNYDFRNVNFGDIQKSVLASEKDLTPTKNDSRVITYENVPFDNYDVTLGYIFSKEGKLIYANYEIFTGRSACDEVYNDLNNKLTLKFGKPEIIKKKRTRQWKNNQVYVNLGTSSNNMKVMILFSRLNIYDLEKFIMTLAKDYLKN